MAAHHDSASHRFLSLQEFKDGALASLSVSCKLCWPRLSECREMDRDPQADAPVHPGEHWFSGVDPDAAQRLMEAIGMEIRLWEQGARSDRDARHRIGLLVRTARAILALRGTDPS
jgi:hypothetical protein